MLKFIGQYWAEKFTPWSAFFHAIVLLLVISQIIISNFIEVNKAGEIGQEGIEYYATWLHISVGLLLLLLSSVFIIIELKRRGFQHFYPYVWGDVSQLSSDIKQLISLNLPDSSAKGLAAVVQGLGLGALFLVVLSGATWFLFWLLASPHAHDLQEVHELLTGLIEVYIIGHATMGLVHLLVSYRKTSP